MLCLYLLLLMFVLLGGSEARKEGESCDGKILICDPGLECNRFDMTCYGPPPTLDKPHAWLGCTRSADDCATFGMTFDMLHPKGDGDDFCQFGKRVRCYNEDPSPLAPPTPANKFTVVSYNIFERLFLVTHDGQRERTCRIPAALAGGVFKDADAIVFQEAFMGGCFSYSEKGDLRSLLKQAGYPYTTETVIGITPENGGVFIASRWPIVARDQYIFKNFADGTSDALASKGVAYAKIRKTIGGRSMNYHVFGTHMQAENMAEAERVRELQATEFRNFVRGKSIPTSEAVIHAGDFNGDYLQKREHTLRILENMNVEVPKFTGEVDCTYEPSRNNLCDPKDGKQWLDFVVANKGHLAPKSSSLQSVRLTSGRAFEVCWCSMCILQSTDYMYPNAAGCESRKPLVQYSDHYPVKGVFEF